MYYSPFVTQNLITIKISRNNQNSPSNLLKIQELREIMAVAACAGTAPISSPGYRWHPSNDLNFEDISFLIILFYCLCFLFIWGKKRNAFLSFSLVIFLLQVMFLSLMIVFLLIKLYCFSCDTKKLTFCILQAYENSGR